MQVLAVPVLSSLDTLFKFMAHFAELNSNNTVLRVLTVNNSDITDANGQEQEAFGVSLLKDLFGPDTHWVQTSYSGKIRKNYAGSGYIYDAMRDAFIPPSPNPSWILNEETCQWEAPVPMPSEDGLWTWDEVSGTWQLLELST